MGWFKKDKKESEQLPVTTEKELKLNYDLKIKELCNEHKLILKEKDFELKHFKDSEVQAHLSKITKLEMELSNAKVRIEMLDKIVDLNAGIIDVKELVKTLISKLPTIDLKNLNVSMDGVNK